MSKTYFLEISEVIDQNGPIDIDDVDPRYFAFTYGSLATVGYAAKEGLADVAASKVANVSVLFTEVSGINREPEDGARVISKIQVDVETAALVLRKKLSVERKAEKGAALATEIAGQAVESVGE